MITPITVPMTVSSSVVTVPMEVTASNVPIPMNVSTAYYTSHYDTYGGAYEFAPGDEQQVVQTSNKVLKDDIIIQPIPSNYGKITYDGVVITVS